MQRKFYIFPPSSSFISRAYHSMTQLHPENGTEP